MRARLLALLLCLSLAACAGTRRGEPAPGGPGFAQGPAGEALTPQAAVARVVLGRSGKAEVAAALGPAIVIDFDSGYAVWVYRWPGADKSPRAATELVLLFDPAGLLRKLRLRPAPGAALS
ncbi:hypothetical protein [Roseateles violae]|uniref:Lipoprotein SmpA/OmlA domain-containing protein n=1 Tax=Roseateles violae TaxID=3058042 RepID=A0ABT8DVL3_9BURK|nr:hypothetical protein [Pelomonas sp. PFR6]MDN3922361.1 hypothetical protein [Pelomonas sp. PFR6]